eukprot:910431-Prymnesium_polylepis.2
MWEREGGERRRTRAEDERSAGGVVTGADRARVDAHARLDREGSGVTCRSGDGGTYHTLHATSRAPTIGSSACLYSPLLSLSKPAFCRSDRVLSGLVRWLSCWCRRAGGTGGMIR